METSFFTMLYKIENVFFLKSIRGLSTAHVVKVKINFIQICKVNNLFIQKNDALCKIRG